MMDCDGTKPHAIKGEDHTPTPVVTDDELSGSREVMQAKVVTSSPGAERDRTSSERGSDPAPPLALVNVLSDAANERSVKRKMNDNHSGERDDRPEDSNEEEVVASKMEQQETVDGRTESIVPDWDDERHQDDDNGDDDSSSVSSEESDEGSTASQSTLLSSRNDSSASYILSSDDDDDENDESHSDTSSSGSVSVQSHKLRKKFEFRDKVLRRLARGKDKKYVQFLRENENAVRREAVRMLERKRRQRELAKKEAQTRSLSSSDDPEPKTLGVGSAREDASSTEIVGTPKQLSAARSFLMLPSMLLHLGISTITGQTPEGHEDSANRDADRKKAEPAENIYAHTESPTAFRRAAEYCRQLILFDFYHSFPAIATILLYCVGHLSIYATLETVVLELTKNVSNQSAAYLYILVFALFLSRISGGVWSWVNDERHHCVKFVMHNRLRLHEVDALILRWFRKHLMIKCLLDIFSFYLCFISVSYFLHVKFMPYVCDVRGSIIDGLPSMEHDEVSTYVKNTLLYSQVQNVATEKALGDNSITGLEAGEVDGGECDADERDIDEDAAYEELTRNLTAKDEMYMYSKVTVTSYYALLGYWQGALVTPQGAFLYYAATASVSIFLMCKIGFKFWQF